MKPYVASHLKDMNRKNVYQFIKNAESTSKAEISKMTGISAPTVIKIVNFLLERRLIVEMGAGDTAIGRKPNLIALNTDFMYTAAFLLEGDFIYAGIVDIRGKVVYKYSILSKRNIAYNLQKIRDGLVHTLFQNAGINLDKLSGIGIALPGMYNSEDMTVSGPLVVQGQELSIKDEIDTLSEKYGVHVFVENDANAQALGEFENRGMGEKEDLVFISLGTGLGAGVILNGKLRRGARYMCGEIGYISYDENYCSSKEDWGWMEANIGYRKLEKLFPVSFHDTEIICTEECRREIIQYVAAALATCISNMFVFLDCSNISLGGKIIEFLGEEFIEAVNERLERLCITGAGVRMQSTPDVGLIGIASMVAGNTIQEILMEELPG